MLGRSLSFQDGYFSGFLLLFIRPLLYPMVPQKTHNKPVLIQESNQLIEFLLLRCGGTAHNTWWLVISAGILWDDPVGEGDSNPLFLLLAFSDSFWRKSGP